MMTKVLSGDARIDGLLSTTTAAPSSPVLSWQSENELGTAVTLDYSFLSSATNSVAGFIAMNTSLQASVATALAHIESIANVSFNQVAPGTGEMNFGTADYGGSNAGFTSGLAYTGFSISATHANYTNANVYITNASFAGYSTAPVGSSAYSTLLHEIGHGLGLDHSFDGNLVPSGTDSTQFTVMSYTDFYPNGFNPTSMMLFDTMALQYLYGANSSYNSGDTVIDLASFMTNGPAVLWDGGGNDTVSLASMTSGMAFDLTEGSFNTVNNTNDFVIAFNASIENATGSGFADTITGTSGNNTLMGANGDDRLVGAAGDDVLDGGVGNDTAVFAFAFTDASITESGGVYSITANSETDTVSNVESFEFTDGTRTADQLGGTTPPTPTDVTLTGTAGVDVLTGADGNDLISGLAGNDRLIGNAGNDTLNGGDGVDTLNGGDGDDFIFGGDTSADLRDIVYAGSGNDTIDGGYGNDLVFAQDGDDNIAGGFGSDTLNGQNGNDVITGSALSDLVSGNAGDDFVNGGFGHDRINGGTGADRFFHLGIFDHGSDWVQDYSSGEGDLLLFGNGSATGSDFQINYAHTATDAGERSGDDNVQEAFVIYRPTGQIMWALVDGEGQTEINLRVGGVEFDLLA